MTSAHEWWLRYGDQVLERTMSPPYRRDPASRWRLVGNDTEQSTRYTSRFSSALPCWRPHQDRRLPDSDDSMLGYPDIYNPTLHLPRDQDIIVTLYLVACRPYMTVWWAQVEKEFPPSARRDGSVHWQRCEGPSTGQLTTAKTMCTASKVTFAVS